MSTEWAAASTRLTLYWFDEVSRYCSRTAGCPLCRETPWTNYASFEPRWFKESTLPASMCPPNLLPTWREALRYQRPQYRSPLTPFRLPRANHASWAQRARSKRRAFIHRLRRSA